MDAPPTLVEVLKELGSNFEDWYPLGLFLGVPSQDLDAIRVSEGPNLKMQFIKMVVRWLEIKPTATWAKLCQALKEVGKLALAEKVSATCGKKAVQQSKRTPPRSRAKTTAPNFPDSVSPILQGSEQQHQVDNDPQGLPSPCIAKTDREAKVPPNTTLQAPHVGVSLPESMDNEIHGLEEEFDDLVDQTAEDIEQSIKEGKAKLSRVKSTVTRLPVNLRHRHVRFLAGKLSAINKAKTVNALFSILDLYWDFMNCGLLERLIGRFGSKGTQRRMEGYLKKLIDFRVRTTVREFTGKWRRKIPSNMSEITMEMGDGWLDKTLEAVEEFKTAFSRMCSFKEYALSFTESSHNSVILCWALQRSFPMSVEILQPARQFLQKQGVLRVFFKRACLCDFQVVPEGATAGGDTPAYKEEYTSLAQSSMEPEHMISSEEDEETDDSDYEKQQKRSHSGSSFSLESGFSEEFEAGEIPSHKDDERALQFADDLRTNSTGHSVKFTKSTISDEAATKLGDALSNNKSLRELKLDRCEISPNGISSLATALRTNTSLRTLRFHDSGLSDQATKHLSEALMTNTTVLELDLGKPSCRNKITSQGASALAEMLCKNKSLKNLSLVGNDISDIGVRKLAEALSKNESLEKLDLSMTKVTAYGASALAETLCENDSLKKLYLWGNKLSDSGLSSLAKALNVNESLEELDLCFNMISDKGVRELSAALRANKSLKSLWFSFDIATDAGADELVTAIEANCTLRRLELVGTSDISEDLQKRLKEIAERKGLELTLL